MTAGLNRTCSLTRFVNEIGGVSTDDASGGSNPSGTTLYSTLYIRLRANQPTQALLEQGLEVPTIYTAQLSPGNIDIQHNDQILITAPSNDWLYNKRFRVIGVQRSSNVQQDRNFVRVVLRRWEKALPDALQ